MEIVVARTFAERLLGLALRPPVPGTALLLPRCRCVHTFGMRYPLDLVWLGEGRDVVALERDVPPGRVRACRRAAAVIEAAAGDGPAAARAWAAQTPAKRSACT